MVTLNTLNHPENGLNGKLQTALLTPVSITLQPGQVVAIHAAHCTAPLPQPALNNALTLSSVFSNHLVIHLKLSMQLLSVTISVTIHIAEK